MAAMASVIAGAAGGAFAQAGGGFAFGQFASALGQAAIAPAIVAGVGLTAAGLVQQGRAAKAQSESQAAMSQYNARVQEREAQAQQQYARFQQSRQAKESQRLKSSMQARMGMSGVDTSAGTPLLIQATQAEQSELDNLLIGYQGRVGAGRARSQAALDTMQSSIYKRRGRNQAGAAYTQAGTSLLTGFGNLGMRMAGR